MPNTVNPESLNLLHILMIIMFSESDCESMNHLLYSSVVQHVSLTKIKSTTFQLLVFDSVNHIIMAQIHSFLI